MVHITKRVRPTVEGSRGSRVLGCCNRDRLKIEKKRRERGRDTGPKTQYNLVPCKEDMGLTVEIRLSVLTPPVVSCVVCGNCLTPWSLHFLICTMKAITFHHEGTNDLQSM